MAQPPPRDLRPARVRRGSSWTSITSSPPEASTCTRSRPSRVVAPTRTRSCSCWPSAPSRSPPRVTGSPPGRSSRQPRPLALRRRRGSEHLLYPFTSVDGLPWLLCPLGTLALLAVSGPPARAAMRLGPDDTAVAPGPATGAWRWAERVRAIQILGPGRTSRSSSRSRRHRPGSSSCACTPAASAAPTCTSSTGTWRSRSPLSCPPPDSRDGLESGDAAGAPFASGTRVASLARLDLRRVPLLPSAAPRTSATARASPAVTSTAATPSTGRRSALLLSPAERYGDLEVRRCFAPD